MASKFPPGPFRTAYNLADRERRYLLAEMVQMKGLLPVLMKRRNKQKWSAEDIAEIRSQLARLQRISPYLVVFVMPGGFAMLPVLAWWLDRRRNRAQPPAPPPLVPAKSALEPAAIEGPPAAQNDRGGPVPRAAERTSTVGALREPAG